MTTLVHSGPDGDDLGRLHAQVKGLEQRLEARAAEIARVHSDLAAFKVDYRQRVGRLHDELDELERAIAEAELGEIAKRLDDPAHQPETAHRPGAPPTGPAGPPLRYTSDAVRKLFRDVAKAIHPDVAGDDSARGWRHRLMIEANRAYAIGDEAGLRRIFDSWARSPEAVQGSDRDAVRQRLLRRVAQIDEQLSAFDEELSGVRESPMWQLKAMVDEAAGQGKDLVGDMVRRLRTDILIARNRLAAMQWTS